VLRDAELPLQPFTLLVGPNGSGKSTVLHALKTLNEWAQGSGRRGLAQMLSISADEPIVKIEIEWMGEFDGCNSLASASSNASLSVAHHRSDRSDSATRESSLNLFLRSLRVYNFDEVSIITPAPLAPWIELGEDGGGLAGVLDQMRDRSPEAFEALNAEIGNLLPEFDRLLFETPAPGLRAFMLRTRDGHHAIPAADLSQGTVLALAILTLAHLESPPSMVCLEEPDRGIHPRLYREIQDALYRLAYPESFGLDRKPVQVLVTTHSPYLLDLHREHPEEVVIAQKNGASATFQQLTQRGDLQDLLRDASLGELWYSGVLGGVPVS
jgi:predicted ATPase